MDVKLLRRTLDLLSAIPSGRAISTAELAARLRDASARYAKGRQ